MRFPTVEQWPHGCYINGCLRGPSSLKTKPRKTHWKPENTAQPGRAASGWTVKQVEPNVPPALWRYVQCLTILSENVSFEMYYIYVFFAWSCVCFCSDLVGNAFWTMWLQPAVSQKTNFLKTSKRWAFFLVRCCSFLCCKCFQFWGSRFFRCNEPRVSVLTLKETIWICRNNCGLFLIKKFRAFSGVVFCCFQTVKCTFWSTGHLLWMVLDRILRSGGGGFVLSLFSFGETSACVLKDNFFVFFSSVAFLHVEIVMGVEVDRFTS